LTSDSSEEEEPIVQEHATIAVDLAKSVFALAVSDRPGSVSRRRRLTRGQFSSFLAEHEPATIVMEACGSAHFWGRQAQQLGHTVVLLPPQAVRPYVLRNKTDGADARALLEALRNDALRAVPIKCVDQHVLAALHRLRSGWMATRTARLNTVRGLLRELGLTIPVGATRVVPAVRALCAQGDAALPPPLRRALSAALAEIAELETRMREVERDLQRLASDSAPVARLRTIPVARRDLLALTRQELFRTSGGGARPRSHGGIVAWSAGLRRRKR
jgi:transposase